MIMINVSSPLWRMTNGSLQTTLDAVARETSKIFSSSQLTYSNYGQLRLLRTSVSASIKWKQAVENSWQLKLLPIRNHVLQIMKTNKNTFFYEIVALLRDKLNAVILLSTAQCDIGDSCRSNLRLKPVQGREDFADLSVRIAYGWKVDSSTL